VLQPKIVSDTHLAQDSATLSNEGRGMPLDEQKQRELDEEFVRNLALAMGPGSRSARLIAELTRRREAGDRVVLLANAGQLSILELEPTSSNSASKAAGSPLPEPTLGEAQPCGDDDARVKAEDIASTDSAATQLRGITSFFKRSVWGAWERSGKHLLPPPPLDLRAPFGRTPLRSGARSS